MFQWQHDREDRTQVLLWEFDIVPSIPGPHIVVNHDAAINSPIWPLVEHTTQVCNCSSPQYGYVLLSNIQPRPMLPASDSDESETDNSEEDIGETEFSIVMLSRGCVFDRYQPAVKLIRDTGAAMSQLEAHLESEPTNTKDCNAILFKVKVGDTWHSVGYVGRFHIPRVTSAMKNREITRVCVDKIRNKYVKSANNRVLQCYMQITKRGKWSAVARDYLYNKDLSSV